MTFWIVLEVYPYSGDRNVADFRALHQVSILEQEAPLVPPFAITQLPTFHYFARMGGAIYKGRIPLLDASERLALGDLRRAVSPAPRSVGRYTVA